MIIQVNQYNPGQYRTYPNFTGKTSQYSTEFILGLIESGKTVKQICAELGGIAYDTYYKLLRERGIPYKKLKDLPERLASVTKNEIEELLKDYTVAEICGMYDINESLYYKLVEPLGVVHPKKLLAERVAEVSEEDIRKCIKEKLTVKQTCERLGITQSKYYDLLEIFSIETPRKATLSRKDSITKSQFEEVVNSEMSYYEKLAALDITPDVYKALLVKFEIVTKSQKCKDNIANITRETLQELVDSEKSVSEICQELGIPERTYSRLLDQFGIITDRKSSRARVAAVTKEKLQELVDDPKMSISMICEALGGISNSTFYKLLKRHGINYTYQHHNREINIPKDRLRAVVEADTTIEEKIKDLGISQTTYNEKAKAAHILTILREAIDAIEEVDPDELQKASDSNLPIAKICERFGITPANYSALIRKHDTLTRYRRSSRNIAQISKNIILNLKKQGKSQEQICDILGISNGTYSRIMSGTAGAVDVIA